MAGDTANARVWLMGDVYVAPTDAVAPTDVASALDSDFEALGLLSADDGLTESREETITDHHAWGGILVRTTRSKHMRTFTVTALEDNAVLFDLLNPGSEVSTDGDTTTRTVKTPTTARKSFVIETHDGDITRRRYIPTGEAFPDGDVQANEEGIETRGVLIKVYPDSDGVLFHDITDDPQAADDGS